MNSFLDVTYSHGTSKVTLSPQYQYNSGQKLRIKGINEDVFVTVHFALRGMVKPIARMAEKTDNVWIAAIPSVLMAQKLPVQAFIYLVSSDTAQTMFEVEIPILERPMPEGYEIDDEEINDIKLMIADLRKALAEAESVANITATAQTLPYGSAATAVLINNGDSKQLQFGIPKGDAGQPGGYYIPVISDEGILTWTTSDTAMPAINSQHNVIGPQGKPGPQGPAGSIDNLPIASPTTLGGVMPVAKTDEMTQAVGVDDSGGLWTVTGEGGGSGSGSGSFYYNVGEGLKIVGGDTLAVDTATSVEQDNTKPVTSGAVYTKVGNINALLATI